MATCTEPDCGTEATRRGLCGRCYQRRNRNGSLPPRQSYVCRINDSECAGGYLGAGLCQRHYFRQYARGTTQLTTLRTAPDDVRYRANVDRRGPADCWPWTASIVKTTGYGQFYWDGRHVSAHIAGWELSTGLIPAGFWIDHTCHNRDSSCAGGATCTHRACQNPLHWEGVRPGINLARSPLTKQGQSWGARATGDELAALVVAAEAAGLIGTWRLPDCPLGHALCGENTYVHPARGTVGCRTCMASSKGYRRLLVK